MKPTNTLETWHPANTGNHQGLIISDADGRNVAVAYDKKDAPLIAAAPELLASLQDLLWMVGPMNAHELVKKARLVILKAEATT